MDHSDVGLGIEIGRHLLSSIADLGDADLHVLLEAADLRLGIRADRVGTLPGDKVLRGA